MSTNNPYAQYKEQSLSTLAPGELLVKLFDELLKQCRLGAMGIRSKDLGSANDSLTKAQTIVSTLAEALDMRYPISKELRDMYVFLAKELLRANLQKDVRMVNAVIPIIKDLRESFDQAEKINRRQQHAVGGRAAI